MKIKIEKPNDVVKEQADDEALWTYENLQRIGEAMLEEALKRLHAAVKNEPFKGYKGKYLESEETTW